MKKFLRNVSSVTLSALFILSALAAYIPYAVTSGNNKERIERATIAEGGSCTASPCTITRQSGSWLTSVTRASGGNYTANFAAGTFSAAPTCVFGLDNANTVRFATISGPVTSSSMVFITEHFNGSATDFRDLQIICMGPR